MTYFASNGKEYPFPLVGVFPKPPARQKYAGRTPRERGGLRVLADASIPEA